MQGICVKLCIYIKLNKLGKRIIYAYLRYLAILEVLARAGADSLSFGPEQFSGIWIQKLLKE